MGCTESTEGGPQPQYHAPAPAQQEAIVHAGAPPSDNSAVEYPSNAIWKGFYTQDGVQ